jgi:membrane-bound lytic murein transglycosylase D
MRTSPSSRGEPAFSYRRPAAESLVAGIFPKPADLEPQVAFWRNVYAMWGRSEVAVHDNRYLNLVYEIVQLPGEIGDGYTPAQKELLQERLDEWRDRLRGLEYKLTLGLPLNSDERQLADRIARHTDLRTAIRGASERVRYQRGLRERFLRGLQISGRYDRLFRDIFRRYGLPEELAFLPHVESSFQANARSSAGAVGIWQFTPAAAKAFIGDDSLAARLDPVASAHGAARYLRHAYDKLGSWPLAITSYNHGIGGMKRAKDRYGHDFVQIVKDYDHPQFGFASRNYYAEFLAACEIALQPELFFAEEIRFEPDTGFAPVERYAANTPKPLPPVQLAAPGPKPKAMKTPGSGSARFSPTRPPIIATNRPVDRTLARKAVPGQVPVRYPVGQRVTKTAGASKKGSATPY